MEQQQYTITLPMDEADALFDAALDASARPLPLLQRNALLAVACQLHRQLPPRTGTEPLTPPRQRTCTGHPDVL